VGTLLQQLVGVVQSVSGEPWTPDSLHLLTQMVSALRTLVTAADTPNAAAANAAAIAVTQVQQAMIDNQVVSALLALLRRGAVRNNLSRRIKHNARYNISPEGIVRFWSLNKAVDNVVFHKAELFQRQCCQILRPRQI